MTQHAMTSAAEILDSMERVIGHLVDLKRSGKSAGDELQALILRLADNHHAVAQRVLRQAARLSPEETDEKYNLTVNPGETRE